LARSGLNISSRTTDAFNTGETAAASTPDIIGRFPQRAESESHLNAFYGPLRPVLFNQSREEATLGRGCMLWSVSLEKAVVVARRRGMMVHVV